MTAQQTATNGFFGFPHTAVGAKPGVFNTASIGINLMKQ